MNEFNPTTLQPGSPEEALLKAIATYDLAAIQGLTPKRVSEVLLQYIATHQVSSGDVSGVLEAAKAYADGLNNETVRTLSASKVDKEEDKGLSAEDFTTFYKEKLDNLEAISAQIVDELPETGDKNCYYFVPDNQSEGANNDFYVTFMYFETLGWKTIGTTKIDLKDYVTFAYLWENNYTKTEADEKFQTKIQILTQEEYAALVTAGTVDTNTTYLIKSNL